LSHIRQDIIALVVQAVGGGTASAATTDAGSQLGNLWTPMMFSPFMKYITAGGHIALAGIVFQFSKFWHSYDCEAAAD